MLPRDRVIAALEHREPDRIPWGEHSIDHNVYEDILGRPTYVAAKFKRTRALWEGKRDEVVASDKRDKLDLVRALEMDIVNCGRSPSAEDPHTPMQQIDDNTWRDEHGNLFHVSATTGNLMPFKRVEREDYEPPTVESLQAEIDALADVEPSDPNGSEWEQVRHAVAEMKDTHFIMLNVGDLEWPTFGRNETEGWMNLVLQPDVCRKIAELKMKRLMVELPTYAALGVDGILPCGDLGSSHGLMASPDIYRDMTYPWQVEYARRGHDLGLWVMKHCCGNIWDVIDEIATVYDAYEGIQASGGMDIEKLKERVGDKTCLWGGIWHEHIIMGSPEDIRQDARYAFTHAAPGGGYIMGSSHSLAVGAKKENVLEMKRCRDEWGGYPIDPSRFV